jgi:transcription-repair coupling factor (superfamily II helicase)
VDFVHAQNGKAKVKDNKIVVRRDWDRERDKIQGAFNIARDLAQKLAEEKSK